MPKYIGLTIGPIYDTMTGAKKIKEIWVASYVFSYIMRKIVDDFRGYGYEYEILIPAYDIERNIQTTGNLPDRFIFKSKEDGDFEKLKKSIDTVLEGLGNKYGQNNLGNYFQTYFLEKEFETDKYCHIVKDIYKYLDSFDNMKKFSDEYMDIIRILMPYDKRKPFLFEEAGYKSGEKKFPLLSEIATAEYEDFHKNNKKLGSDEDDKLYENLSKHLAESKQPKLLKPYKYIAVVSFDGDDFGKKLVTMENEQYKEFSKKVSEFSNNAADKILEYGGLPIYAGGDEALFVAPVINSNAPAKNIFRFIDTLRDEFKEQLKKYGDISISFGISISYYKFPIGESIKQSYDLLEEAKNNEGKNSIAFKLLKHSGQSSKSIFKIDSEEYNGFLKVIDERTNFNLLSSILFKMENFENFFKSIIEFKDKESKIENFFENFFNEEIHKQNREVINNIKYFFLKQLKSPNIKPENLFSGFFNSLRLIKFLGESINE